MKLSQVQYCTVCRIQAAAVKVREPEEVRAAAGSSLALSKSDFLSHFNFYRRITPWSIIAALTHSVIQEKLSFWFPASAWFVLCSLSTRAPLTMGQLRGTLELKPQRLSSGWLSFGASRLTVLDVW